MLQPGDVLQRGYVIERVLGSGGMGAVYLARQPKLNDRRVAIKEMLPRFLTEDERSRAAALFQREAAVLAAVDHRNVVDVKDFFEEGNCEYLVMAYVDGCTLERAVVDLAAAPAPAVVLDWADQICDALEFLHRAEPPILMRDLKPNNIMLDKNGRIRLIDFGLARLFEPSGQTDTLLKGAGTAGFCPLEQFTGDTTDTRSDIFSLGATLYFLLTRKVPPNAYSLSMDTRLEPIGDSNAAAAAAIDAVVARMMATRKEERYQTIGEVREALRAVATGARSEPDARWDSSSSLSGSKSPLASRDRLEEPAAAVPEAPVPAQYDGNRGGSPLRLAAPRPAELTDGTSSRSRLMLALMGLVLALAAGLTWYGIGPRHSASQPAASSRTSDTPSTVRTPSDTPSAARTPCGTSPSANGLAGEWTGSNGWTMSMHPGGGDTFPLVLRHGDRKWRFTAHRAPDGSGFTFDTRDGGNLVRHTCTVDPQNRDRFVEDYPGHGRNSFTRK